MASGVVGVYCREAVVGYSVVRMKNYNKLTTITIVSIFNNDERSDYRP